MSDLEDTFAFQLTTAGIEFEQQVKGLIPGRQFVMDFFFRKAKLIVEINGGTWMQKSGHNTARGIQRDYEKANLAQLNGFMYLQYTSKELDNLEALDTVKQLLEMEV
jgi:very-short-patch-repair endonuclease